MKVDFAVVLCFLFSAEPQMSADELGERVGADAGERRRTRMARMRFAAHDPRVACRETDRVPCLPSRIQRRLAASDRRLHRNLWGEESVVLPGMPGREQGNLAIPLVTIVADSDGGACADAKETGNHGTRNRAAGGQSRRPPKDGAPSDDGFNRGAAANGARQGRGHAGAGTAPTQARPCRPGLPPIPASFLADSPSTRGRPPGAGSWKATPVPCAGADRGPGKGSCLL